MNWEVIKKQFPIFFGEWSKTVPVFVNLAGQYVTGRYTAYGTDLNPSEATFSNLVATPTDVGNWLVKRGWGTHPVELVKVYPDTLTNPGIVTYEVGGKVYTNFDLALWDALRVILADVEKTFENYLAEQYDYGN